MNRNVSRRNFVKLAAIAGTVDPPIVLPAAVIACAVNDAIGRPIRNFPITPEAVLSAIMEAEGTA